MIFPASSITIMGLVKVAVLTAAGGVTTAVGDGSEVFTGGSTVITEFPFSADLGILLKPGIVLLLQDANKHKTGMMSEEIYFILPFCQKVMNTMPKTGLNKKVIC